MAKLFTSKVDALKVIGGTSTWFIGDKADPDITAAVIGAGNYLFDPLTGKSWSSDGSLYTETTETLPAGTTNHTLRFDGTSWVDTAALQVATGATGTVTAAGSLVVSGTTSSTTKDTGAIVTEGGLGVEENINAGGSIGATGAITAGTGISTGTGNIVASTGNISSTAGSVSAATTLSAGTTVTAGTGITATAGNITASTGDLVSTAGAVSASTTVTAGTGVIATTGGVTATAGGLTATAGGLTVTAGTSSIKGNLNLDGTASNTLTISGSTTSELVFTGAGTRKIKGLTTANITAATDAANKEYVDNNMAGLDSKEGVYLATTAALAANYFAISNTVGAGNGVILTVTGGSGTFDPDAGETIVTSGGTGTIVGVDHATAGTTTKIYIGGISGSALTTSFTSHSGGVTGLTISSIDTTSITSFLAYSSVGVSNIDSVAVTSAMRILVKNMANAIYNGIYTVKVVGSATLTQILARALDHDGTPTNEISTSNYTFITAGTINSSRGYILSATDAADPANISVHTETKVFTQFSASTSITVSDGTSIDVVTTGNDNVVNLNANLTSGAGGFTVADTRIPVATAANTLGVSTGLSFDDGTTQVLSVGTTSTAAIVLGHSSLAAVSSQGTAEPFNGALLATNTNSKTMVFETGSTSGTGVSGTLYVHSGDSSGTAGSGAAIFYSGNVSGSGTTGVATFQSGSATGGGDSGNVNLSTGNASAGNSGSVNISTGSASGNTSGNISLTTNVTATTRGTITFNAAANDTKLTNSATTDTQTGTNLPNVADISFIREKVVLRNYNAAVADAGTLALAVGTGADISVKVVGSGANANKVYTSKISAALLTATTVDASEYAIVGNLTGITIAVTATGSVITVTVTNGSGAAAAVGIQALPLN